MMMHEFTNLISQNAISNLVAGPTRAVMPRKKPLLLISAEQIERRIYVVRGQRVMLDSDLASLYGVTTMALNQARKRNPERFPGDFAFQLTQQEFSNLISQIVISSGTHGG